MKTEDLPSQYELCRIAAALFGAEAAKKTVACVRKALELWLSARYEIARAADRSFEENVRIYSTGAEGSLADAISEDELEDATNLLYMPKIAFGSSLENSAAISWLDKNAEPQDHFKTFRAFDKAWIEIFGDRADENRNRCCEVILRDFLRRRKNTRRAAATLQKQRIRKQRRQRKEVVK